MINKEMSNILSEMADLSELAKDNPFRIRAFRRAAETIQSYPQDLGALSREEQLAIPGIGKGIADFIAEFKEKGRIVEHQKLKSKFPEGVLKIMHLQGLGAKRAGILFRELRIDSLEKLKQAAENQKIRNLDGFGEKIEENILKNISFAQESSKRMILYEARTLAKEIMERLKKSSAIGQLELAGSARRWKETVGDLDFLCSSTQPEKAIQHFLNSCPVDRVLAEGKTKASVILKQGIQCDFRVVPKKSIGAALMYFTGSKEHNVRLRELAQKMNLTLNEYGLFKVSDKEQKNPVASETEEDIYKALGMKWIPPELREDRGEVEASLKNKLPVLIEESDVRGDFHNHTTLSDGDNSLEEMVAEAQKRGWSWFFSADHSPSLKIASGLPVPILKKKMDHIKTLNKSLGKFKLFCSTEADILHHGDIDYPDDILKTLDCVVASVHSRFNQTEEEMTERLIRAVRHPYVDILGHISGRKLNKREGYALNYEKVLQAAKETGTAIEINGQPERSEIQDIYVKRAIELGVPLALSTDAHSTSQLEYMTYAVHIARRGWAEKKHIINTMDDKSISRWFSR